MGIQVSLPYPGQRLLIALAVGGAVDADHIPAVTPEIVAVLKAVPHIKGSQRPPVFLADAVGFRGLPRPHPAPQRIIIVDAASIDIRHTGGILRPLHASFYLEGIDARLYQPGDMPDSAHILQAQRITFLAACPIAYRIGQTAGLGAAASVAAASPQDAAEQALSRIAVAHGAMDECLHLDAGILPHGYKLLQAQLPGGDDADCAHVFQQRGSPAGADGHLRAHMELQPGEMFPDKAQDP